MQGLIIEKEKCKGCGICIKTCAAKALCVQDKKAQVNDDCVLCGICIDSCPFKAISIKKEDLSEIDLSEYKGIWVFAEQLSGEVQTVAFELICKGRELAEEKGTKLTALLFGNNVEAEAQKLLAYGANRVILCDDKSLADNLEERYVEILGQLVEKYKPEILLFGATGFGRSVAPRLAAHIQTGLTADCTQLEIDKETGLLKQTRPAFGGNLMATIICPNHRPQMATVRPGVMPVKEASYEGKGEVIKVPVVATKTPQVEILEQVLMEEKGSIADAEIIVSAGKGIGSQKNLELVKKLAQLIGGTVGASRPLVDIGWSQYKNQIGQTGFAVAPKLLITCGISGAIQHLAGISGAKTIIAINSDPDAPIFSVADYKVVGDCVEILKKLIACIESKKALSGDCTKDSLV